jgi:hypothetical protein
MIYQLELHDDELQELDRFVRKQEDLVISENLKSKIISLWEERFSFKVDNILNKLNLDECKFLYNILFNVKQEYHVVNDNEQFLNLLEILESVIE